MTGTRLLSRRSRKLAFLLLAVAGPPAVTLVWLGLQLLQQERSLQTQRRVERQQAALTDVVRSLEGALADAERRVADGPVPGGTARFTVSADSVMAEPADGVLWLPARPPMPAADSRRFANTERLEFQGEDAMALASYRAVALSAGATVRAGALLRVARITRRQQRWDDALRAYERLTAISDVEIEGAPSDLQARRASCSVLEQAGRTDRLRESATALEADLLAGRWRLDRPAWELTAADLARWLGRPVAVAPQRAILSAVADRLWQRRLREPDAARRVLVAFDDVVVTVLQEPRGADLVALAGKSVV